MDKRKKIIKEIINGGIIALAMILTLYFIFTFYFYGAYSQYRLTLADVYLQVRQLQNEVNRNTQEMLERRSIEGEKALLRIKGAWVTYLNAKPQVKLKDFIIIYLGYRNAYKKAKSAYVADIKRIKCEIGKIRREARVRSGILIKRTKEDANPFSLIISGAARKEVIKGYRYDPVRGEIEPN